MGTVGYMSPEQVRGQAADHRADIFAFGAILYEMLAGKRAFQKPTSAETMTAILNEDPPGISQVARKHSPSAETRGTSLSWKRTRNSASNRHQTWRLHWRRVSQTLKGERHLCPPSKEAPKARPRKSAAVWPR